MKKKIPSQTQGSTTFSDSPEITSRLTSYSNVDDDVIIITGAKLEVALLKYEKLLNSGADWKTPLGLIITIIITKNTAVFNSPFLGVEADVWEGIFIIVLIASIIWLICSLIALARSYKHRGISTLIQKLKNQENNRD